MSILISQFGLNITENQIQLVEIAKKENTIILENVDEEFFEESVNDETKEPKFIHILQNAFNEIILRKPLSTNHISVSIPNSYFKIFELPTDKNLTKNDLDEYIKWEISKLFPAKGKDYFSFNKIIIDSLNYKSVKTVLVYAIPTFLLKRIHKFCHRNSLKLSIIDNSHTSIIPLIQGDSNLKNILSIHIENKIIAVLLMKDGKINAHKRKSITNISEIPDLIENIIEELRERKLLTENINQVYVSGNSINTELKKSIEHKNNISIIELNPFDNIEIGENLKNNKFILENKSKFITAACLALRKLS